MLELSRSVAAGAVRQREQAGPQQGDDLSRVGGGELAGLDEVTGDRDAEGDGADQRGPQVRVRGGDGLGDLGLVEAIREYTRRVTAAPLRIEEYEVAELYQTQDPAVVVVEMRSSATPTTTGRSVTARSIQVLRIHDGHIALFRDYADPRIFEALAGELRLDG